MASGRVMKDLLLKMVKVITDIEDEIERRMFYDDKGSIKTIVAVVEEAVKDRINFYNDIVE